REAVFDGSELPKFVLPPPRFRFGAADRGGEPGEDDDRIAGTAICNGTGTQVPRIGDAFLDRLRQREHRFGLRCREIAAIAGSACLHGDGAPLWRAGDVEWSRHRIMWAAMRDRMHLGRVDEPRAGLVADKGVVFPAIP